MQAVYFGAGIALVLCLAGLWLTLVLRRWHRSWRARRRAQQASKGEVHAESLLEAEGYRVIERQVRRIASLGLNGGITEYELRADYLVERDGHWFVAEVKTGLDAPRIRNAATRRQLLEYAVIYQCPIVLLVDVEAEAIHQVDFGDALRTSVANEWSSVV